MIDYPMKLGALISELEAIHAKSHKRSDGSDPTVWFDFEYARPTGFDSWRGVYAHLAIGFSFDGKISLPDFLNLAKEANGALYDGYKGGLFKMDDDTPLWVANYSNCGKTAVSGVIDNEYNVIIETAHCVW